MADPGTIAGVGCRTRRDHRVHGELSPIETALGLAAVVLLILANVLFVAAEFALVAVDRSRMDHLADGGSRRARIVSGLLQQLSFHLSGVQLGITLTSLVLGFLAQPTIARVLEPALEPVVGPAGVAGVALAVALVLATVAQMVVGELIPKGLSIARPDRSALVLAPLIRVYGLVIGPVHPAPQRGGEPHRAGARRRADRRAVPRADPDRAAGPRGGVDRGGDPGRLGVRAAHPVDPLRAQDGR